MSRKYHVLVVSAQTDEAVEIADLLAPESFQTKTMTLGPGNVPNFEEKGTDVYIFCLPDGFRSLNGASPYTLPAPGKLLMYVTSNPADETRLWCFQQGAGDVLVRPFSAAELNFRVERLVAMDEDRLDRPFNEATMLAFLETIAARETEEIVPALEPLMPFGHFYPDVARALGRTPRDGEFLDKLAAEGMLTRKVYNRVKLCPVCNDYRINFREVCPKCGALNFEQREMIHHIVCGYVGRLEEFRKESGLTCPKCAAELRHAGQDYEKPLNQHACRECGGIFAAPKIEAQCLECGYLCAPAQTLERIVHSYRLTPVARTAVAEGHIHGIDLASFLHGQQAGLYTRQFITLEMQRETYRYQRYGIPFSLAMIRIDEFDHIRTAHAAQAEDFTATMFRAMSRQLRPLDFMCVWDVDILAILLCGTGFEGAQAVAQRLYDSVRSLEYLYSIHEPNLSMSLVCIEEGYDSPEAMIQKAVEELNA